MLEAFFASDNDDERLILWRDDPALLLPAKPRMNIFAAIINATNFQIPNSFPSGKFKLLACNA